LQQFPVANGIFKGFKESEVAETGNAVVIKGNRQIRFSSNSLQPCQCFLLFSFQPLCSLVFWFLLTGYKLIKPTTTQVCSPEGLIYNVNMFTI
jgi:hypothetical protein